MSFKPVILVDCDNVLCDFTAAYLDAMFVVTGRMREHRHVTSFNFTESIVTVEEDRAIWRHLSDADAVLKTLKWEMWARDGLARLRDIGRVVCVTAPASIANWVPCRNEWLHNAGFSKHDIVYATDKSLVAGDFFIEDRLETLAEWTPRPGPGCPAGALKNPCYLINKPWNRGPVPHHTLRVESLLDAAIEIESQVYSDD